MSFTIKIRPDGTLASYIPKKVFSALYHKQLIQKVNGDWIIPEEKRADIENLEVVTSQAKEDNEEKISIDGLTLSVGDLFYTSWGYDQTNYDFLVVEGFSKSGKSAYCRMTKANFNPEKSGKTTDALKPKNEAYGDKFMMRIKSNGKEIRLRGSYPFIYDGDMSKGSRLATFWRVDEDRFYFQTSPGFGH